MEHAGAAAAGTAYDWHNYGKDTIGARSDVENVDIGRLQAFYRTYYQPDNAVLVVAGRFDPDEALGWIAKDFGAIPKPARPLPRLYTDEPVQDGERSVSIRRVGDTQLVGILYHTVPGAHPDAVAVDALGEGHDDRAGGPPLQGAGRDEEGRRGPELRARAARSGLRRLLGAAGADRLDGRRARRRWKRRSKAPPRRRSRRPRSIASARRRCATSTRRSRIPQRLGVALSESIALGDWRLFFLTRDRWRTLTAADVQRVAAAYLKPSNRTVGMFVPEAKPDRAPRPPAVDVAAMVKDYKGDPAVAAGEVFDATPANLDARAQRFTLANGMKVALLPKKTRGETVKLRLQVHQGDEKSLFGKAPLGTLAAYMLKRGTAKHSRQEIEDTLDRLRSKLAIEGGETSLTVAGETTREQARRRARARCRSRCASRRSRRRSSRS